MPKGTRHRLTGLLLDGQHMPVLEIDGGGRWRLDCDRPHAHLLGRRVIVDGVRSDFDVLTVERIWRDGTPEPPPRTGLAAVLDRLIGC
jgi:hypothetical protein